MPRLGYLLPTRERIMEGLPETAPLLALAERAEALGFDSVWVGDSLLARPRHDPLTRQAAVAARSRRVDLGTAMLLPANSKQWPGCAASWHGSAQGLVVGFAQRNHGIRFGRKDDDQ